MNGALACPGVQFNHWHACPSKVHLHKAWRGMNAVMQEAWMHACQQDAEHLSQARAVWISCASGYDACRQRR